MNIKQNDIDLHEAIRWGYRLILGREPEARFSPEAYLRSTQDKSLLGIRNRMLESAEFAQRFGDGDKYKKEHRLRTLVNEFTDHTVYAKEDGFFRDCFGIRTRVKYLPKEYAKYSGALAGDFGKERMPIHDEIEISGMLEGVRAAKSQLVVMELGAGWGPWITLGAKLARKKNISYRLIGVEALQRTFDFMLTHLRDNDVDPAEHAIIRGAVGPHDVDGSLGESDDNFDSIRRYSISTLLATEPIVDILHCDIQGAEAASFETAIQLVTHRVRRVIVGTHGRRIEEQLFNLFSTNGWHLVEELPCSYRFDKGVMTLDRDGTQVWLNNSIG